MQSCINFHWFGKPAIRTNPRPYNTRSTSVHPSLCSFTPVAFEMLIFSADGFGASGKLLGSMAVMEVEMLVACCTVLLLVSFFLSDHIPDVCIHP